MKIYSKTGDDGSTGLLGGDRTSKTSLRIEAIGAVDELNAALGVVRVHTAGLQWDESLDRIQRWLFDVGAELACPPEGKFKVSSITGQDVEYLERSIDEQTMALPVLKAFILPGGSAAAAQLHLARAVCRRAEREVGRLHACEPVSANVRIFLNRLSDWLFVAARTANMDSGVADTVWTQSEAS